MEVPLSLVPISTRGSGINSKFESKIIGLKTTNFIALIGLSKLFVQRAQCSELSCPIMLQYISNFEIHIERVPSFLLFPKYLYKKWFYSSRVRNPVFWVGVKCVSHYSMTSSVLIQRSETQCVSKTSLFTQAGLPSQVRPTRPRSQVLYMCSIFWLCGVESRDFSHAEKERTACKAEKIHKITTIFTQNNNLGPF